jgi:hypothetical protein
MGLVSDSSFGEEEEVLDCDDGEEDDNAQEVRLVRLLGNNEKAEVVVDANSHSNSLITLFGMYCILFF